VYNADYINPKIELGENTKFSGLVFSNYPYHSDIDYQPYLNISKNATILGSVYWPGKIQLSGEVIGQTYVDAFICKTALGTYRNFIINGTINKLMKENSISLPSFFPSDNSGEIVKWLY